VFHGKAQTRYCVFRVLFAADPLIRLSNTLAALPLASENNVSAKIPALQKWAAITWRWFPATIFQMLRFKFKTAGSWLATRFLRLSLIAKEGDNDVISWEIQVIYLGKRKKTELNLSSQSTLILNKQISLHEFHRNAFLFKFR